MKIALIVVPVWLAITTVCSLAAGWYRLAASYPNRTEEPLLRARVRYGSMGLVYMQNLITLRACTSGPRSQFGCPAIGTLTIDAQRCDDDDARDQ